MIIKSPEGNFGNRNDTYFPLTGGYLVPKVEFTNAVTADGCFHGWFNKINCTFRKLLCIKWLNKRSRAFVTMQ